VLPHARLDRAPPGLPERRRDPRAGRQYGHAHGGYILREPAVKRLRCWLFGHRMYVWQNFTKADRRVVCDLCGGDWAMNDTYEAFVPWDEDCEKMHRVLGHFVRPRKHGG
jgi:hypothetical protein